MEQSIAFAMRRAESGTPVANIVWKMLIALLTVFAVPVLLAAATEQKLACLD